MADIEKTKTGIFEMLQRNTWQDIDEERHRFQPVLNDALELLEAQDGLAKALEQMTATNDYLNKEVERLETEQPKWIPVSERLPKKEDIPYDCLVTLEHGVVCEATFLDMDAPYHKWCANTGWLYHVTHWMPLPKPPKKDGEQE